MPESTRRPFQFSVRSLFYWTLGVAVFFGLANLPEPANVVCVYLFSTVAGASLSWRSRWMTAIMAGVAGMASLIVVAFISDAQGRDSFLHYPDAALSGCCCCFPVGVNIGLFVDVLFQERRNEERFKERLKSVSKANDECRNPNDECRRA